MTRMKIGILGAVLMILAGCGGGGDRTGDMNTGDQGATRTINGTVESSTSDMLVVNTADGSRMQFHVDDESNVPDDIASGQRVRIEYRDLGQDNFHVTDVERDDTAENAGGAAGDMNRDTGVDRDNTGMAAGDADDRPEHTISGTLASHSGTQLVINTPDGRSANLMLGEDADVPDDLAAGHQIEAKYHDLGNNQFHATNVRRIEEADDERTVSGTLESAGGTSLVLNTPFGNRLSMNVDPNFDIPTDLAAGQPVEVKYRELGPNQFQVTDVERHDMAAIDTGARTGGTYDGTTDRTATTDRTTGTTGTTTTDQYGRTTTTDQTTADRETGTTTTDQYGRSTGTTGTTTAQRDEFDDTGRTAADRELPATASPLPLIGLSGLVALGAGLALRRRS